MFTFVFVQFTFHKVMIYSFIRKSACTFRIISESIFEEIIVKTAT